MADPHSYPPSPEFVSKARIQGAEPYRELRDRAARDPAAFWGELAEKELDWFEKWSQTLDWNPPFAKWFVGGKINASYNCLDRHLATARKNKAAIIWEGEPGDQRILTYQDLHREVSRFANGLKKLGCKAGDRAIIYMPMVPELPVALLACARLGVIHSVVFGGFSAEALKVRIQDLDAGLVITADGGWRRGKEVKLKATVEEALPECPSVRDVVVLKRTGSRPAMKQGRDHWWHELTEDVSEVCPAEPLDSEHPLFVLYTSGTTGKPKGIVHTTAGYILQTSMTMKWVFDLREEDTYWCTADIGWVTGHSYIVYGPLAAGATSRDVRRRAGFSRAGSLLAHHREISGQHFLHLAYRDSLLHPAGIGVAQQTRYVEPAAAWLGRRADQSGGVGMVSQDHREGTLSDRRHLVADGDWRDPDCSGSGRGAGEAWLGDDAVAGHHRGRRGFQRRARRGRNGRVSSSSASPGRACYGRCGAIRSAMRRITGSVFLGNYLTGDAARRDSDGYFWVLGRVDDVMNVSGHRLSTMELESALVRHPAVAEAAVVGKPHEITGQAVAAFVTLKKGDWNHEALAEELRKWVGARDRELRQAGADPVHR